MPVIHDGMNTYTMRNGKMVLVSPEHETMGANGTKQFMIILEHLEFSSLIQQ